MPLPQAAAPGPPPKPSSRSKVTKPSAGDRGARREAQRRGSPSSNPLLVLPKTLSPPSTPTPGGVPCPCPRG